MKITEDMMRLINEEFGFRQHDAIGRIEYSEHCMVTKDDAHICKMAADVATIEELNIEDINSFLNGMAEHDNDGAYDYVFCGVNNDVAYVHLACHRDGLDLDEIDEFYASLQQRFDYDNYGKGAYRIRYAEAVRGEKFPTDAEIVEMKKTGELK